MPFKTSNNRHQILLYHRIVPDDTPRKLLEMLGGELVTQRIFSQQLSWVAKRYQFVDLDTLLADRDQATPLATVTFDDGMVDNYSMALPILRQLSIPSTIFVISGSIGQREGMHHHRVARWAATDGLETVRSVVAGISKPRGQLQAVLTWLAQTPQTQRDELFPPSAGASDSDRFLNADEIGKLTQAGVSIQSHTVSHTPLSRMTDQALEEELTISKNELQALTQREVKYLAYPIGRDADMDARSAPGARKAGYVAAFTAKPGHVDHTTEAYFMPRQGVRNSVDRLKKSLIARPFWRR